jgi:hypothetical protein
MNQPVEIGSSKKYQTSIDNHFYSIWTFEAYKSNHRHSKFDDKANPNNKNDNVGRQYLLVLSEMASIIEHSKSYLYFFCIMFELF